LIPGVLKSFLQPGLYLAAAAVALSEAQAGVSSAEIRVNQAGFACDDGKEAYLMASAPVASNAVFQVFGTNGVRVFGGGVGDKIGSWNNNYPNVYRLDFSALTNPGTYSITFGAKVNGSAISPPFQIGPASEIYGPLLRHSLFFFQAQRDGPDVLPNVLGRKPSHLADKQAFIYETPKFGSDGLIGGLKKIGGPVDVSGGWADAGDYLKFVETATYVTAMMLQGARDYPTQMGRGGTADFQAEGRIGLDWLLKMWDGDTKTLYLQVGIGDGNSQVTGDHDLWRLPEKDDENEARTGAPEYFIKHRPIFEAGPSGSALSPNLAGRLAADFALGYQVFKTEDPAYAKKLLFAAEQVFDMAATTNVTTLTTAIPRDFYPEDEWRDDLEWGAVELYFALSGGGATGDLPHNDCHYYLRLAGHWAADYIAFGQQDSLNLYDVSGIAHYELCRALDHAGPMAGLEASRADLVANLQHRLDAAIKRADNDPFGLGYRYGGGDVVPHVLGLALEAGFYDKLTQTTTYADFSQRQLDFVLGANAWGTSFIVGAGKIFPFHLQHQIANLKGSLDGAPPLLLGATVDGPSRAKSGGTPDGARATPWPAGKNPFTPFDSKNVRYIDDVGSWATVEPADDYTIPTALLFARLASK
jgi:hypothetical protein